jgi:hypothetical protein
MKDALLVKYLITTEFTIHLTYVKIASVLRMLNPTFNFIH